MIKKENHRLTPISTIKIIDLYVSIFHSTRKVFFICYFIIKISKKVDMTSFFYFGFLIDS